MGYVVEITSVKNEGLHYAASVLGVYLLLFIPFPHPVWPLWQLTCLFVLLSLVKERPRNPWRCLFCEIARKAKKAEVKLVRFPLSGTDRMPLCESCADDVMVGDEWRET